MVRIRKSNNYYNRPIKEAEWDRIMNIWNMNPEERKLISKNNDERIAIAEKIIDKKIKMVFLAIAAPWIALIFTVVIYFSLKIDNLFMIPIFVILFSIAFIFQQYLQKKNIETYTKVLQVSEAYNATAFDSTLFLAKN
jgi:hypothetical protein